MSVVQRAMLTDEQRRVYDTIYDAVVEREELLDQHTGRKLGKLFFLQAPAGCGADP